MEFEITINGKKSLDALQKDIEEAINYLAGIDGKLTEGDEFVPDGKVYKTTEEAEKAASNPEAERAWLHELNEVEKIIKG